MRTTPAPRTDFARWLGKNQMDAAPCACVRAVGRGRSPGFTRRKSVAEWFSKGTESEGEGAWGSHECAPGPSLAAMSGASVQCQIGGNMAVISTRFAAYSATHSLALFAPEPDVKPNCQ